MRFSLLATTTLAGCLTASAAPASGDDTTIANLARQAYDDAHNLLSAEQNHSMEEITCSLRTLRVCREWRSLSTQQRKAYMEAVQCLQEKPALTPSSVASGAKTRFDDFVATHINQTNTIHYTANFLSWHRYFVWLYEEALREECGFHRPVFDGSDSSMSGNGASVYTQDTGEIVLGGAPDLPSVYLPTGTGGGCVESGPFRNMSVNLGPAALAAPGGITVSPPSSNPLDYNPRCLKRDLVDAVNQRYANASSVVSLLLKPRNAYDFQMQMQGIPGSGDIGVHSGGHYTLGGDPGNDVFVSPGDPVFYLHHSNIDRLWWIWQSLAPKKRQNAIAGTKTFMNSPPSANGTLDDSVGYGYAAGPARPIKDLMSTISGPLCYVYL